MKAHLTRMVVLGGLLLGGCAVPSKYYWGTYEPALYQYYKTPAKLADLETELARTIKQAGEKGQKVPPGVYAEYAYVLQQRGNAAEAVAYYQKEKQAWPESAVLMDTMLRSVETGKSKSLENKSSHQ